MSGTHKAHNHQGVRDCVGLPFGAKGELSQLASCFQTRGRAPRARQKPQPVSSLPFPDAQGQGLSSGLRVRFCVVHGAHLFVRVTHPRSSRFEPGQRGTRRLTAMASTQTLVSSRLQVKSARREAKSTVKG